jgi:hypothetical protein
MFKIQMTQTKMALILELRSLELPALLSRFWVTSG